jgi:tetratricopeptide (TPR) repeat protein
MSGPDTADILQADSERLLAMALARPHEALAQAKAWLALRPSALRAAVAHQAIGVVQRDFGNLDEAIRHLRTALRVARRADDPVRAADIQASLGVALVMAGRTRQGLRALDTVIRAGIADGLGRAAIGRLLIRRVWVLWSIGRYQEALTDADRAVTLLRGTDPVWEARAYDHRATTQLARGALDRADRDYAHSEVLFHRIGQRLEYADTRRARAAIAFARGDLPTALAMLDDARQIVDELQVFEPELHLTRCTALLAAGLAREAAEEIEAAVERSRRQGGSATRRAELLTAASTAAQAVGDYETATNRADEALRLLRRQARPQWAGRAELALLTARHSAGVQPGDLLRRTHRLAGRLERARLPAAEAHFLAGQLALHAGQIAETDRHLAAAASGRGGDLQRQVLRWHARALLALAHHDSRTMLVACRRGLALIDQYLGTLGATELRAEATRHGAELANLALRHAVRRSDPWQVLRWSERWRAVALAVPPVRRKTDPLLAADLTALRHLVSRLDSAAAPGRIPTALQVERRRLEAAVRRRVLHTSAVAQRRPLTGRASVIGRGLDEVQLIEVIDLDEQLYALVVRHGRAELVEVGPTVAAERTLEHALFSLRRASSLSGRYRRPHDHLTQGTTDLEQVGARLERVLLGSSTSLLVQGPVVIVPTGRLHATPWAMLPSLRDRDITVVPSASTYVRARDTVPRSERVVLVGGPNLSTGVDEVLALAQRYPDAIVLTHGEATVERVLGAADGARLVHIAAHGSFRADSPLFSALELDDGPLTVYDLESLHRAPYHVVLSSCDSAVGAPSGADELLGIVTALISLGSAGVLASVVRVDDPSTVPLMIDLHHHLRLGVGLSQAHLRARQAARPDPARRVTADSFIPLGA